MCTKARLILETMEISSIINNLTSERVALMTLLGCFGQWPIASGFGSMLNRELEESVDSDTSNIECSKPSTTEEAFTIPQIVH